MKKKNNSKCMLSVFISMLLFLISVPNCAFAMSDEKTEKMDLETINQIIASSPAKTTVVVDEISKVKEIKSYTEEELYKMGCTKEEVDYIQNYDYNKDLIDLSEKNAKELGNMGYTDEQIEKIQDYNGTTDAVEYVENNSLSNATLTLGYAPYGTCNTSRFSVLWNWNWSSVPIFQGTDIAAFTWIGATSSSTVLAMDYYEKPSVIINYCMMDGTGYKSTTVTPVTKIGCFSVNIPMAKNVGNLHLYANNGGGYIKLKTQSGSSNLYSIQILGSYGHSTMTVAPSVSFDTSGVSLGITYDWTMEELSPTLRTYKFNGSEL